MNVLMNTYSNLIKARQVLFVLESCHAGLAIKNMGNDIDKSRLEYFKYLSIIQRDTEPRARNMLVASAGAKRAVWLNGGGIFTNALISGLNGYADYNSDSIIQFEELAFYIRNYVSQETRAIGVKQDPDSYILDLSGNGRMLFLLKN